jgi:Family of unknown function (DUF6585)
MDGQHTTEEPDLGERVEEYRASSLRQLVLIALGLALVAGGLFLLWVATSPGGLLALLPCLAMLGIGAFVFWRAFSMARLRVVLFEKGFIHWEGQLATSFSWGEIEAVDLTETEHRGKYGNALYYTHSFRIRAAGGREVALDDTNIGDGEALGRAIMREVRHCQLTGLLRRALSLEAAGQRDAALDAFEQLLRESPYNEMADQVREHIERLRLAICRPDTPSREPTS